MIPAYAQARILAAAVGALSGGLSAGCPSVECVQTKECAVGFDCTLEGVCVTTAQGEIRWIAPEAGSIVGQSFDAVVEVSFRAPAASITIDRDVINGGDPCAPFVSSTVDVAGDIEQALVQRVTVPGLLALGAEFGLSATLNAAGGVRSVRVAFTGEPTGYQGARFVEPGDAVIDASTALSLPVSAVLDRAASRALISVEPLGGDPSPREVVGGGVIELEGLRAPLARGPQILWLDTEDELGAHRCGRGLRGESPPTTGVELGLSFEGDQPGQLDLHVLLERPEGDVGCTFIEPGTACAAVYESRAPTRVGEEVLLVHAQDGVLIVAVVPGAAGPSLTARVRVSHNGIHVGWLGPFPLQPALGEVWIAGRIILGGALARLERIDDVVIGAPF